MKVHDLIIIGGGPAGMTAGLYAGRFRLDTLILEKASVGGQILFSPSIENYPGFPGGIATQELMDKFKAQLDEVGVPVEYEEVLGVEKDDLSGKSLFRIKTSSKVYQAKCVIAASGAQPKRLGVEGEEKFTGRGVSYCGTCDGPLFKNKEIFVVGGGDRALEDALFLSGYASKVNLVHRRDKLRASRILEERAMKDPKINFILESVIEKILGQKVLEKVVIRNLKTKRVESLAAQGVFIFVGIVPSTNFLKNLLQIDEFGFIITKTNYRTSEEGIFACGDCLRKDLYQVVTACAEGASAAEAVHKYIIGS